jgi:hypothetical protein
MMALALMGGVAVGALYMLAECRELTRARCYGGILQQMLGPRCSHVANGLLALYAWGGGVTYLMILGKELQAVVSKLASDVVGRCEKALETIPSARPDRLAACCCAFLVTLQRRSKRLHVDCRGAVYPAALVFPLA